MELKDCNLERMSGENLAGKITTNMKALSASILTLAGASLKEGGAHWPGRRTMRPMLLESGSGPAGRKGGRTCLRKPPESAAEGMGTGL